MVALRDALTRFRLGRKRISFDQRDGLKVIGKNTRCEQTGQTRTDNDCMFALRKSVAIHF